MKGRTTASVHRSLIIRRMSDFEGQKKKLTSSGGQLCRSSGFIHRHVQDEVDEVYA